MCGITGLWNQNLAEEELLKRVEVSTKLLEHRGPDDSGIWHDKALSLALGHRRLSIIDATSNAHQPMIHKTNNYALVFNGEIYNYRELEKKYKLLCHDEKEYGDTAVLLELLVKFGVDALEYLDGMFAFAFFDKTKQKLTLARDRFGEKPLYWNNSGGIFCFSSEITTLVPLINTTLDINEESLAIYHMMGSVPAPRTIYTDIHALEPGSFITINTKFQPQIKNYWDIKSSFNRSNKNQKNNGSDATQELLINSVRSRMVSDVPVGIFLSGGIDSNSILATLNNQKILPDMALSVDFPESEYSEFSIAQTSAEQFGVPMERLVMDQSSFTKGLPTFFSAMDQPTMDGFNTFFLTQAAQQIGIKVWLTGVGGDELFGGYPSFKRMMILSNVIKVMQKIMPSRLMVELSSSNISIRNSRILNSLVNGPAQTRCYQSNRLILPPAKIRSLLNTTMDNNILLKLLDSCYPTMPDNMDAYQAATYLETSIYMASQLLRDIDNFSMAHSIEVRAPFLEHHLFQNILSLNKNKKIDGKRIKPLLQDMVPGGLPSIIPQTIKRGFTFPIEKWLKTGLEKNYKEVVLNSDNSSFWNLNSLENIWKNYEKGKVHWTMLWNFYSFSMWAKSRRC
jgi:asparagine synthase (glutamine-hydrolysing)